MHSPLHWRSVAGQDGSMTQHGPFESRPEFDPSSSQGYLAWHYPNDEDFARQGYAPNVTGEERTWAILAHLSAVIAWFVSAGWISFIGPLLVWAIKKDSSPYVRQAAAQSFNFNIGMALMTITGWIMVITVILLPLGFLVIGIAWVLEMYHHIKATIRASDNKIHRYPFQIKILS